MMTFLQVLTATTLLVFVIAWDVITDKKKYLASKVLDHTKEWWLRFALASPSIIIYAIPLCFWFILLTGPMVASVYWISFDALYNKYVLKTEWWTIKGTTSKLDRFQQRIGWRSSLILKVALSVSTIFFYLKAILK